MYWVKAVCLNFGCIFQLAGDSELLWNQRRNQNPFGPDVHDFHVLYYFLTKQLLRAGVHCFLFGSIYNDTAINLNIQSIREHLSS